MSLHPQAVALLEMFKARNLPPIEEQDLQVGRAAFVESTKLLNKIEDILSVEDIKIQGYQEEIAIRIYTPNEQADLPAFVYFHGGGWVIGNIDTHDPLCRMFANEAQCKVISVDYSLAPEHRFPVGVEDAYLATKYVFDHAQELGIDSSRIAVGGDSAGGNFATVVCYLANQRKDFAVGQQLLFYPSTGFEPTDSYEKYSEGYYLTKSTMQWFRQQYFNQPSETQSPLAAPMLIPDEEVALLPPAYILTAEYDPLCDGGENYANKLENAGVETTYICYPGMIHGFMCMTKVIEDGEKAIREAARYLKNQFSVIPAEHS
ncbi:acetyl esterase [Bacillus mesophilus]|uniref:Alpha/beta hydrolase n=1 Tax=Bacillus mesophilus TaxID=1808955 RepID=A0A6M0Q8I7_9BACI|nr:alpha/beta hydrolase [Bacillus mesophilus]MBM7661977.1 acetyl esterase [Bacillus mesophilus]NEY72664.1 alpha/beta hydrolase [Bacillus mesophilus]